MKMIEEFLKRFIFISDLSSKEAIDLKLTLKSLPSKIDEFNVNRISMLNFNMIQKSSIAFQNDDQDELFRYYDNRSKTRFNKLFKKANDSRFELQQVREVGSQLLSILNRISQIGRNFMIDTNFKNIPSVIKKKIKERQEMKIHPDAHKQS